MPEVTGLGTYSRDCLDVFDLLELGDAATQALLEARHGKFTPLGDVLLMGEPVAAGIKRRSTSAKGGAIDRVARELYLADRLLTAFPARSANLPLFTYPVVNPTDGRNIGILTEDFTRGGTRVLDETSNDFGRYSRAKREDVPEGLHRDVYDALNGNVYGEAFRHMIGFVFDREVLIDYDDVAYPPDDVLDEYRELIGGMTLTIS